MRINRRLALRILSTVLGSMISRSQAGSVAKAARLMPAVSKVSDELSPLSFGAYGDGKTDDTVALQQWVNYVVTHRKRGLLGNRTYRISAPLNIPAGYFWAIDGEIPGGTRILQAADNMPIFNIGSTGAKPLMHTWRISNIEFDYINTQPVANENANPILISEMICEFELKNLRFSRGSYGIKVKPGVGGPWGGDWDELVFTGGLTGGAMRWTGCVNAVPNNKWGRFFIDCRNMIGPVFQDIRGYDWTIDTIEFVAAERGAQLLSIRAGSICSIGALKVENGIYNNSVNIINIETRAHVKIDQFSIGGNRMLLQPIDGELNLFAVAVGGPTGSFCLNTLMASATVINENVFIVNGYGGQIEINNVSFDRDSWQICDNASTKTGDTLILNQFKNDYVSENLGDIDKIVNLGDPNVLSFETLFSSPRIIDLPNQANKMFSGLYYEIRLYGAVNGKNNLTVRCGTKVLFVMKIDKSIVRFEWRRNASAASGWIITQYGILP